MLMTYGPRTVPVISVIEYLSQYLHGQALIQVKPGSRIDLLIFKSMQISIPVTNSWDSRSMYWFRANWHRHLSTSFISQLQQLHEILELQLPNELKKDVDAVEFFEGMQLSRSWRNFCFEIERAISGPVALEHWNLRDARSAHFV